MPVFDRILKPLCAAGLAAALIAAPTTAARGCTGIRLVAEDGAVVYGRTMEWGAFDLNSRVAVIPRGHPFAGTTPEGASGRAWSARYGAVALDMLGHDWFADGVNEAGLAVGMFYHPGFAEYPDFDPDLAADTIGAPDLLGYILTRFATIDEVMDGLQDIRVVGVTEPLIGVPDPAHWMVTEPSGRSLVIEYRAGAPVFFDNPLGVLTNAPRFDWHMTNLRNHINLSAVALPDRTIAELDFAPLGAGSGMIGLPGDYTPPSRFVRAVAWTQTARPMPDADEAVYEALRILDNFNLPLGGAEGAGLSGQTEGMRSSTIWTSVWDLEAGALYFHTQHNRRLRMVRLDALDFDADGIAHIPLDPDRAQDVLDLTQAAAADQAAD
jgi:choloylglycine hydrolase